MLSNFRILDLKVPHTSQTERILDLGDYENCSGVKESQNSQRGS